MVMLQTSHIMNTYQRYSLNLVKGKGAYVWDDKGEKYLDFTSGIAVCNLGHVPEGVKKAVQEQLEQLWHCSNLFLIQSQEKLAMKLCENSCFDEVFFCNSGAEANEAAIKLARKYAFDHNKLPHIVSFKQSFHGRTMATLSATGQEKIQKGFHPLVSGFSYLNYNDYVNLNKLIDMKPCAVILELVQGEGGVIPAKQEWIEKLTSICKKEEILIIVDEVQTGMGRTGKLFAYEYYNFEPDMVTLAKGLGSGFPIGAMLAKKEVAQHFTPGTHGSTFGGNPLAATAGLETVKELVGTNVLHSAQEMSFILKSKLEQLKEKFTFIKDVRGLGLMIGIEIDGDPSGIVQLALEEKLLILTAGNNTIRLLPPLTITENEIERFFEVFQHVLNQYKDTDSGTIRR